MNPITIAFGIAEDQVINFFKTKKALSQDTAIELSFDELKKSLDAPELLDEKLTEFTYIKRTTTGKYYLDEKSLKSETNLVIKIILIIFLLIVLISILPIIFYLINQ
jgi:hypothetical protein